MQFGRYPAPFELRVIAKFFGTLWYPQERFRLVLRCPVLAERPRDELQMGWFGLPASRCHVSTLFPKFLF
jgi:hypothetical protein